MQKKANKNPKTETTKVTGIKKGNNKTATELKREIEQLSTSNAFSEAIKENKRKKRKKTAIATAAVLGAGAAIVTPVIIYRTKFQEYEISVESTAENFQSYSVTLRKGSTISNLKQKLNVFEGHTLIGIYQDENCTTPFADTDKVTKDTKVYLKYEKLTYSISLPSGSGLFEIQYSTSVDISKLTWGESFTFRIETGQYTFENATVTANGVVLTPDAYGNYLIPFVDSNIIIRVDDLNLTDYTIGAIPSNVTVFNARGRVVSANSQVFEGETLTFIYTETEHYSMSTFEVNEIPVNNNVAITVNEDITINYEEVFTRTLSFQEVSGGYACQVGFEWNGDGEYMGYYVQDVVIPSKYHNLPVVQAFGLNESDNNQLESNGYSQIFNSVTIPDTVTTITESYKHFRNIYFDSTKLEFIAEDAFEGCTLEPFILTSKLTNHHNFGGASELKSLTFDSSITQISDGMIGGAKINDFIIPSTINFIGSSALSSCQFENITIENDDVYKAIAEGSFFGAELAEETTITVSKAIVSANSNAYLNNSNYFTKKEQENHIVFTKQTAKFSVNFTGGDLSFSFSLSSAKYGSLQVGVDQVEYGDTITITYYENSIPSREGRYEMSTFEVNGVAVDNNYSMKVTGDVVVKYEEVDTTGMEFTELSSGDYACAVMCIYNTEEWYLVEGIADNAIIPSKYKNKEVVEILADKWTDNSILNTSVVVPGTIKKIHSGALGHFQEVIINTSSLEEIAENAFLYSEYAEPAVIDSFTITNKLTECNSFGGAKINNFIFATDVTEIPDRMFENMELSSITLPSSIQKIGAYAFAHDLDGNNNVAQPFAITLNAGLEEIGEGALRGSGLTEITLPNTLETIGNRAFEYTLIENIEIPASVKTIGDSAFACDPVSNCDFALKSITLNEGLESIGENAFFCCFELRSINLPNSLTSLGKAAFADSAIVNVTFGTGLTSLPQNLFYDTLYEEEPVFSESGRTFTTLTIPSNIKTIGANAFRENIIKYLIIESAEIYGLIDSADFYGANITQSTEIHVLKSIVDNESPSSPLTYSEYLNNESTDTFVKLEAGDYYKFIKLEDYYGEEGDFTSTNISNGVKYLGTADNDYYLALCLDDTSYKNITLEEGCEKIADEAFKDTGIETVKLASTVKTIGASAFANCQYLNKVELNSSLTEIGNYAFQQTAITSIEIPSSVKTIGDLAFAENLALATVTFNEGLQSIGLATFQGCSMLDNVVIPSSVTSIDEYAFIDCDSLKNVTINSEDIYKGIKALEDCGSLVANAEIVTVPLSILDKSDTTLLLREANYDPYTYEPDGSFSALYSDEHAYFYKIDYINTFTNFTLPENTKEIGAYFFYGKTNLTSVELNEGLETIGKHAFAYSGITSIEIPSSVKTIGYLAFMKCSTLETVTLNEGLETIGYGSFSISGIKSIVIPNSVTTLESMVFKTCENLTQVTLGSGIESISLAMFADCAKLLKINLPEGVETIEQYAFSNCESLEEITIPSTVTSIVTDAFSDCTNLKNVTINSETIYKSIKTFDDCGELIKNADVVKVKSSLITDIYDISVLLCDAQIPNSSFVVLEGADYTYFYSNNYMATVADFEFPSGVTTMGSYFFENANLNSVKINDTLGDIGYQAFAGQSFDELTIPSNVSTIYSEAFMGATIERITLLSAEIYKDLIATDEYTYGGLAAAANTLYVPKTIVDANENALYDNAENYFKFEAGDYYAFVPVDASATELVVPEGVITVDIAWFTNVNENIISLTLPSSVESIVNSSSGLKSLTIESKALYDSINWPFGYVDDYLFMGGEIRVLKSVDDGSNYVSPSYWIKIDDGEYNTYLSKRYYTSGYNYTKITEENNVRYAGDDANPYHTMLTVLDRSLENYEVKEGTVIIGYRAFSFTTNLKTVNLPNTVQVIDKYSFSYAYALEELVLSDSVTTIGDGAFNGNGGVTPMKIKSLVISKNVTNIGELIFYDDVSVSSMTIESATWYADTATSNRARVIEFKIAKDIYDSEHEYSNTENYLIFESENYIHCINKSRAGVTDDIEAGVVYTGIATDGKNTYLSTADNMYHTLLY